MFQHSSNFTNFALRSLQFIKKYTTFVQIIPLCAFWFAGRESERARKKRGNKITKRKKQAKTGN